MEDVMKTDGPSPEDMVAKACDAILDKFVERAARPMRKAAEAVYEDLLYSVQDHLKDNARWNLANTIERCRRVEMDNIRLRQEHDEAVSRLRGVILHWQAHGVAHDFGALLDRIAPSVGLEPASAAALKSGSAE